MTLREHGGASVLVGNNIKRIRKESDAIQSEKRVSVRLELWDGLTLYRCLDSMLRSLTR